MISDTLPETPSADDDLAPASPASAAFSAWFERYKLLILAVIATFALHGALLLSGSYRGTYDAYVHIFFADHYARSWWNPWEPRWYTGFTLVSYPPLTHQLTALLSKFTSLPGGFGIVMLTSAMVTTIGVYRFSRLWIGHRPALYAALLTVFSSSIAETVHVFGQLPTMFVIGVMLNALPFVWQWVDDANLTSLVRGWSLLMVAAAGHHVTTLFGMVFFSGPILATVLVRKFHTARSDERTPNTKGNSHYFYPVIRRVERVMPAIIRCGVFGAGLIVILVLTVLPYWLWSRSDPITQITIPHSSRDSFIENTAAGFMFFLVPWGVLMIVVPYAFYKGFGSANWILAGSLAAMAFIGTGGTTPIPAKLLGGSFYILTLDRFTFWSTIIILPFAGLFVESLVHGRLGGWIVAHFGMAWRLVLLSAMGASLIAFAIFVANLTQFRKFQSAPIDMIPIVEFLAKDNHDKWRYLTLGFGDQMAWLSAQTPALNVEGNYHSARRLPELTSTPIERLDGAKFTEIPGLGSLQQFVTNPQRYNLKYVFVNDDFYEPLLYFAGWHRLGILENDVQVWERADVPPLPAAIPVQVYPAWQRLMWGTLPVGSLFVASFTFLLTGFILPRLGWRLVNIPGLKRILHWKLVYFWLLDVVDRRTPDLPSEDWQLWKRFLKRFLPEIRLTPRKLRVIYGVILAVVVLGGVGGSYLFLRQKMISPEAIVFRYYDAIDFKRFSEAYTYLATDLTLEEYLRWLSLKGGLLSSFAKLENLYTVITDDPDDGTTKIANIKADWLTALGTYVVDEQWSLVQKNGDWRLKLSIEPPPVPRETFIGTADISFFQDLPLGTLDNTALTRGILDRSLLSVSSVKVVYVPDIPISFAPLPYDAKRIVGRFKGLISVIGAVKNLSPYPAQLTITATLRDANGERIAETNVMDMMIHQLLPQEITPFRVDFVGADAAQILDLDTIVSADLIVRGLPTSNNLARPLALIAPNTLYNTSTKQVDVPRVLATFSDANGELEWVEGHFLEYAIGPDESRTFVPPTMPKTAQDLRLPVTITGPRLTDWSARDTVPLFSLYGYSR